MQEMLGLTKEENEEYIKMARLEARAITQGVKESCSIRCTQLQEKSRKYIEENGYKIFHVPVKGTSYFVDVLARSRKEAMSKSGEAFSSKINARPMEM